MWVRIPGALPLALVTLAVGQMGHPLCSVAKGCVRYFFANGDSQRRLGQRPIFSPTAIVIVGWGNSPGHWIRSVAFWPTAIVKPQSQTYADVQVAGNVTGTGDVAALATSLIAIQPGGLADNRRWQAPRPPPELPTHVNQP
jgi:hypothetical protein